MIKCVKMYDMKLGFDGNLLHWISACNNLNNIWEGILMKNSKNFKRFVSFSAAAVCMLTGLRFAPLSNDEAAAADTLTAFEITEEMQIGWNLGNSMDATVSGSTATVNSETAWGNPKTTQALIDAVKAKGFNTVRIPTTWYQHLDADNNIDPEWMARVHEIVDYCFNNDMYVILNLHHENWVNRTDLGTAYDEMKPKLLKIWQQIADEFSDYDQHLIFESMNEPRAVGTTHEWWGPEQSEVDCINQLNADFVELIRNDDSPYADTRLLMIPGYCASSDISMISKIVVPDDDYVAVSIHAYSPYGFTMDKTVADHSVFTDAYAVELTNILEGIRKTFIENDIPVVIGEFSASNYDNTEARCEWADLYISTTKEMGVPCVLWDNDARGNSDSSERHDYLDRKNLVWYEDSSQVVDTMMSVLADDSIVWGGKKMGTQYSHDDIDSGENVYKDSAGMTVTAGCTQNFDFSLSGIEGKDIAIKFTGDVPLLALMDGAWGGWTEISAYDIDEENGIAYYSYDSIKASWTSSAEPEHMCFKSTGTTTITQVSIINMGEEAVPTVTPKTDCSLTIKIYDSDTGELVPGAEVYLTSNMMSKSGVNLDSPDFILGPWTSSDSEPIVIEGLTDIYDSDVYYTYKIALTLPEDYTTTVTMGDINFLKSKTAEVEIPVTKKNSGIVYGDANGNGTVEVADAVFILQGIADPSNEEYKLSKAGSINADCCDVGNGVDAEDALAIQQFKADIIESLPVMS